MAGGTHGLSSLLASPLRRAVSSRRVGRLRSCLCPCGAGYGDGGRARRRHLHRAPKGSSEGHAWSSSMGASSLWDTLCSCRVRVLLISSLAFSTFLFIIPFALVFFFAPCYAFAGEVDNNGGQNQSGFVQVSSSEGQEETSLVSGDSSCDDSSLDILPSSFQNQNFDSVVGSISSLAVSGGFSGGSTSGGFSGGGIRLTDDGLANNFRFLLKALGYNVAGNGEVSTNGGGLLGVFIRIGWAIDNIWADTGQISEDVAQSESVLRSMSDKLDDLFSAVSTIGNYLHNGSGSIIQAAQSALTSLSTISSRLISGDMGAASWLNRISSQLGSLSSIVTMLSPGGLTNSQISNIITSLGGSGSIASRLSTSNTHLGNLVTLLGPDGLTGTQLSNIIVELSNTGCLR